MLPATSVKASEKSEAFTFIYTLKNKNYIIDTLPNINMKIM